MKTITFILTVLLCLLSTDTLAYSDLKKQAELDAKCESARQVKLKPRKQEIYKECVTKFKKSKSVCKEEADVFNGNRINGAPMFYELPACVKAFDYRKKTANQ